jgi:hypothetical protein
MKLMLEEDWEEDRPLILKPKFRPISANILDVADSEATYSSNPTLRSVVVL